jgi:phospholipid/cholesterol/gamma-HCH transport system ATP-binding protein
LTTRTARQRQNDDYIQIDNLHFRYRDRTVFRGIDMRIPRGGITAIMGPSGSGKTSLLRLIAGQLKPGAGTVRVGGTDIHRLSRSALFRERRKMGFLFQSGALFTDLSVYENVAFPLRAHTRLPDTMIRDLVLMKLEAVGLRGARHLMPATLSGGMARRVALARAIVLDPELILYDEPFAGQDPISTGMLAALIKRLNDTLNLTSIIISHDVPETASIARHAYVLADGQVAGQGPIQEILESRAPEVRQFVKGLPDGPVPFHYPAPDYRDDLDLGETC